MTHPWVIVLIVFMITVVAIAGLILRNQTYRRIRLGIFLDRNGDNPPDKNGGT